MKFFNHFLVNTGKLFISFMCLLSVLHGQAQDKQPENSIQFIGGYSKHGSGDLKGIVFGTEYIRYTTKKFSLNYNVRGTINSGRTLIIVNDNTMGTRTDASIRFTTAGVQLGVNGQYSLMRNPRHEFLISLGAFGRYQSASNGSDGYRLYSPQLTGQPTILVGYDNRTPQQTVAFGGILQLQYNFTFKNNMYVGVLPGFQTDTKGDAIAQVALTIGKRLF